MSENEKKMNGIDARYVADLARLEITEKEAELYGAQLDDVLDYVNKLGELDIEDIEPTAHANPLYNIWREDIAGTSLERSSVLANAPAREHNSFIQVPAVIEEDDR